MSSAVEFTNGWLHKDIPTKRHPTAREVNSEFTGLVKVIKLRREKDILAKAERTCVLLTTAVLSCYESVETEGHMYMKKSKGHASL